MNCIFLQKATQATLARDRVLVMQCPSTRKICMFVALDSFFVEASVTTIALVSSSLDMRRSLLRFLIQPPHDALESFPRNGRH